MAVAMRALDATVETVGSDGQTRQYPIAEFHTLPGSTPHVENVLKLGELIAAVTLPPAVGGYQAYHKVRDRASYASALISVAVVIQPHASARVALVGVAPRSCPVDSADPESTLSYERRGVGVWGRDVL